MSNRPDVYKNEEGTWTFRASAIGACIRGLVAARLGIHPQPPAEFLATAMEESSLAEGIVKTQLAKRGMVIQGDQEAVFLDLSNGRITGHLDGLVEAEGFDPSILEVKALGRTLFERYMKGGVKNLGLPFSRMYGMQLSAYMYALQKPAFLVVYGKEHGLTLEKFYEEPPYEEEDLNTRMGQVLSLGEREQWPECDAQCSPSSFYWHVHPQKEIHQNFDAAIADKVERAKKLRDTISVLTDQAKTLTDEIKAELGRGTHDFGRYKATIVQKMTNRVDYDKIRRDHGDEFLDAYRYEVPVVELRITDKTKKKGE